MYPHEKIHHLETTAADTLDIHSHISRSHLYPYANGGRGFEKDIGYHSYFHIIILCLLLRKNKIEDYRPISDRNWGTEWNNGRILRHARSACSIVFHLVRARQEPLYGYGSDIFPHRQFLYDNSQSLERVSNCNCRKLLYILRCRRSDRNTARIVGIQTYTCKNIPLYSIYLHRGQRYCNIPYILIKDCCLR